jgi:hypothetical protein
MLPQDLKDIFKEIYNRDVKPYLKYITLGVIAIVAITLACCLM